MLPPLTCRADLATPHRRALDTPHRADLDTLHSIMGCQCTALHLDSTYSAIDYTTNRWSGERRNYSTRRRKRYRLSDSEFCGSNVNNFMIFWKLRKIPFKWCHQTSYLRDKNICQFGDTIWKVFSFYFQLDQWWMTCSTTNGNDSVLTV